MASSKPFRFLFLVSLFIFLGIFSNNDLKLKSTVAALNSNIKGKRQEVRTKEEKIQSVKDASEAEGNVYDELKKQIFELKQELEMQRKRSLEVETRAEVADTKVSELSSKLENIDGQWFLSKLGLNPNKTMTYVKSLWNQHLSQTLQKKWIPSIKDSYVTLTINLEPKVQYLTDKSIEMSHAFTQGFDVSYDYLKKWIPSIKDSYVTLTIYLEPKVQYLTDKSIEMSHAFTQGFDVSYDYLKKWIPSIKDSYVTLTIYLEPKVQYLTDKSIEMSHAFTQGFDVSYDYLKKWIPSIKDSYVTLTIYLEPKVQYLTDKSIEMSHAFTQGFDVSYDYLKVTRIMTLAKPHLEKVQLVLEPCTKIIRHGFNKLIKVLKRRNNELK